MRKHKIVRMNTDGQRGVTLPKELTTALKWEAGDIITFEILGRDKLKIEKVKA